MPFTTTHVLAAIILIEVFRGLSKIKLPRYYILIAAIAGVIPDFEYFIQLLLGNNVERMFMHSLFLPLILVLVGLFVWKFDLKSEWLRKKHLKLNIIFFIFAAGCLVHMLLDYLLSGTIMPLYPLSDLSIGLDLVGNFGDFDVFVLAVIDGILLFFWIFWMEFKLKISDYF